ncbi:hypothetical protein B0T10DRAFT_68065 [Thelonectria olida]|uniref:Uncharacterized protein n=1 Tax=Thelonectria olida TaxID=1576542 RepID=A0A9P9ARS1_9HYPO|nr:hypothetical protein B0T10DRAFT_68065 [Thelonectria olida]
MYTQPVLDHVFSRNRARVIRDEFVKAQQVTMQECLLPNVCKIFPPFSSDVASSSRANEETIQLERARSRPGGGVAISSNPSCYFLTCCSSLSNHIVRAADVLWVTPQYGKASLSRWCLKHKMPNRRVSTAMSAQHVALLCDSVYRDIVSCKMQQRTLVRVCSLLNVRQHQAGICYIFLPAGNIMTPKRESLFSPVTQPIRRINAGFAVRRGRKSRQPWLASV